MRRTILLCLPLALLVACSGAEGDADTPAAEEVFTQYLVDEGIAVNQEGAESFIEVAGSICEAHDAGASDVEVIGELLQSSGYLSSYQVGQLHGAAVASYCPEYTP